MLEAKVASAASTPVTTSLSTVFLLLRERQRTAGLLIGFHNIGTVQLAASNLFEQV